MTSFDAIIIGGGHNGLTAATILAQARRKVLLLEKRADFGGAAQTVDIAPGFRSSGLAHLVNRLDPGVVSALRLDLSAIADKLLPTVVLDPSVGAVVLRGAYGETVDGVTPEEAQAFAALRGKLLFQADILKRFLARRPPEIGNRTLGDVKDFALGGLKLLSRGREEARDFLRMLLMNVADVADEYLVDERLKALLAFDATLGIHLGPRSPTSLLGLYYRLTGEVSGRSGGQFLPKGGMGRVGEAFVEAARKAGVTLCAGTPVRRLVSVRGKVEGVELETGERLDAPVVVAAIHPKTTFLSLADPGEIDTRFRRQVRHIRSLGSVAKLDLALGSLPRFTGLRLEDHDARIVIARSVRHVEDAFNPAKYGEFSPDPVMEITLPSLSDSSLAPPGGATLSALVQYAPHALRMGWAKGKPAFLETVLSVLERHAPGLRDSIVGARFLVPPDIEAEYNMPGGHWHHGELQVDQLLVNRPVDRAAGYETPVSGLYLASAGSHPGGGISGLPGLLAARHILSGDR